jgi:hypothetical protein
MMNLTFVYSSNQSSWKSYLLNTSQRLLYATRCAELGIWVTFIPCGECEYRSTLRSLPLWHYGLSSLASSQLVSRGLFLLQNVKPLSINTFFPARRVVLCSWNLQQSHHCLESHINRGKGKQRKMAEPHFWAGLGFELRASHLSHTSSPSRGKWYWGRRVRIQSSLLSQGSSLQKLFPWYFCVLSKK